MPRFAVTATALAVLLSGTAAFAEISAAEVWADMRALMEGSGQNVTVGSEEQVGDRLTVRDIVIDMQMPEASSSASLDEITFVERGDGTVEIVLSPEYRIVSSSRPADGPVVDLQATMRHAGLSMVVSGDTAAKTYTFSAGSVGLEFADVTAGGDALPITATIDLDAPSGHYLSRTEANGHSVDSTLVASALRVAMGGTDETGGTFDFKMDFVDMAAKTAGFLPKDSDMADLSASLRAGFGVSGEMTHGASTYAFKGDFEGSQSEGDGTASGGAFDFAFSEAELSYGAETRDVAFSMRSSDIPLPEMAFAMEQSAFRIAMPAAATAEPGDFAVLAAIRGFTISDSIWALFDPMAALPRDPATVAFDISGKAKWLIDIFSPEAAAMGAPPGELSELTLNDLEIGAMGAELTGTGAFTFDNTDLTTFEGMPAPEGAADLQLVGGNGLLDKLVTMGFVPEEQAMGFRMMLGLFATVSDGEDTLVSKIEVTADGQVLANGQRIR